MKTKYIYTIALSQRQFFLLMIVPILLGFMITLISNARAEWDKKDDPHLFLSPQKQGWTLMGEKKSSCLKVQGNAFKTVSR